jgi:hypothetical protein
MNKTLKVVGKCSIAVLAAVAIRAGLLCIEDSINRYDKKAIVNKYAHCSAAEIQNKISSPEEAQQFAEAVYGSNGFCGKAAKTMAYVLKDDDYPSKLLYLEKEGWGFHWFFMYKRYFMDNGTFGKFKCRAIDELVKHVEKIDNVNGIKYKVFDEIPSDFNAEEISEDVKMLYSYQSP